MINKISIANILPILMILYFMFLCIFPSQLDFIKLLILFFISLFLYKKKIKINFFYDTVFIAVIVFILIIVSQNIFNIGSFSDTLKFSGGLIVFFLGKMYSYVYKEKMMQTLIIGSTLIAAYITILYYSQYFGINFAKMFSLHSNDLTLTFRNVSRTGLYAAIGSFICIFCLFYPKEAIYPRLAIPTGIALFLALILAGRRVTLAAVVVAGSLFLICRRKFIPLFLGAFLTALLVFGSGQVQRFNLHPKELITSIGMIERQAVWYAAWELFKENPVLGCGFKTFKEKSAPHIEKYREFNPKLIYGDLEDAHNIFLHLLAENGIIGFAFIVFLFYKIINTGFIYKEKNIPLFCLSGCFIVILAHLQLHMHLYSSNIHGLFFLLIGLHQGLIEKKELLCS
jgi:O-antigen ligase